MTDVAINYQGRNRIHPQKFALYAAMASIVMMFIAFTSAYMVRQAAGNWQEYVVPNIFYFSTALIITSSVTLHIAFRAHKNGNRTSYTSFLILTMLLGAAFVVMQYFGWQSLYASGVPLDGNPSGSFFYVISGVHAAHVLGGVAALAVATIHAITLPFQINSARRLRFSLVVQYWHFVDILWVYLFVFLLIAR